MSVGKHRGENIYLEEYNEPVRPRRIERQPQPVVKHCEIGWLGQECTCVSDELTDYTTYRYTPMEHLYIRFSVIPNRRQAPYDRNEHEVIVCSE